ncbi:elongation factor 1-beta [Brevipalpus obovatus]|uniref:elongation factor 1-beta n=1 Tax=Brevipalpus obovatus TaxID=246614 RepID=UPI003D9DDA6C
MAFKIEGDANSADNLANLNKFLSSRTYVENYTPSQSDVAIFDVLMPSKVKQPQYPHVARWWKHICSFSDEERSAFPGIKKPLGDIGDDAPVCCAKPAAKPAASKADDDELDLFGSEDDEEAEKLKAERVKAYQEKKAKKPALVAKSNVILDVKPWEDETDMKELEMAVRKIQADGMVWGASKLVPIAYGIKKLTIVCVVEDDKISIDWLTEEIEKIEDYVQSVDIAAFQKI